MSRRKTEPPPNPNSTDKHWVGGSGVEGGSPQHQSIIEIIEEMFSPPAVNLLKLNHLDPKGQDVIKLTGARNNLKAIIHSGGEEDPGGSRRL